MRGAAMALIWICKLSLTNCVFHSQGEVGWSEIVTL